MIVCGIDPGLETSGYAVVECASTATVPLPFNPQSAIRNPQSLRILEAGVCRSDPAAELPDRLAQIEADFAALFEPYALDVVAVEQLYAHYKHPRTAVLMGHARGVIIATAARCGIAVTDLAATQVKRYLTGNGRASKAQVQQAVMSVYGLTEVPEPNDVADALAIAFCAIGDSTERSAANTPHSAFRNPHSPAGGPR